MTGSKNGDIITQEALSHLHAPADVAALGGVNQIVASLGSNVSTGLPPTAVEASRAKYGPNRLPDKEPRSFWSHLLEAFEDDTLRILLASAFFSLLFAFFFSENSFVDGVQGVAIISAAVIVSGVKSFQNWSKDREFKSLSELKSDFKVLVLRSSKWSPISVYDVVVGDIVRIITGIHPHR
jgi:Ca2+-transporting ATPase